MPRRFVRRADGQFEQEHVEAVVVGSTRTPATREGVTMPDRLAEISARFDQLYRPVHGDWAVAAGGLHGDEVAWLMQETRRLRAENVYLRERGHCPDCEAALAEHEAPAAGELCAPNRTIRMQAVVTRVDRPGPPPIIDDSEDPPAYTGHTVVYDVGEDEP